MEEAVHAPVAVVGMAALFPGAGDLETFWHNIVSGVDAITDAPPARLDPCYDQLYCRRGGFIDDLADFAPEPFGLTADEVAAGEPDQFLALRVAAEAIADAGGEDSLADRDRVGVIIGRIAAPTPGVTRFGQRIRVPHQLVTSLRELAPAPDEAWLAQVREAAAEVDAGHPSAAGLTPSFAASRIANRLALRGPAYTVDGACASSLLAIDHAFLQLAARRCDVVIAGGVHHCQDVILWTGFSKERWFSPSGRMRPFASDADGVLLGEGTGMVVLKRLADARRTGDRIYAVIRGTGVASDGGGGASSILNPLVGGQVLALRRAWQAAGLDPAETGAVGLVEGHGAGNPASDAIELATLAKVFGTTGGPIGLGSVKSMIGHAMGASGIAAFIKAVLALHHRVLPPTLYCDDPHPAMAGTRFAPVNEAREWRPGGDPRRAGVNAFGLGGVDAHVVLEEVTSARAVRAHPVTAPTRSVRLNLGTPLLHLDGAVEPWRCPARHEPGP